MRTSDLPLFFGTSRPPTMVSTEESLSTIENGGCSNVRIFQHGSANPQDGAHSTFFRIGDRIPRLAAVSQSRSFQRSTTPGSRARLEAIQESDTRSSIPFNLTHTQWPLHSVPPCCRASCWPSAHPWPCAPSTPRPPAPFFPHCPRSSRAPVRHEPATQPLHHH